MTDGRIKPGEGAGGMHVVRKIHEGVGQEGSKVDTGGAGRGFVSKHLKVLSAKGMLSARRHSNTHSLRYSELMRA